MVSYTISVVPAGSFGRVLAEGLSRKSALHMMTQMHMFMQTMPGHGQINRYKTEDGGKTYSMVEGIGY